MPNDKFPIGKHKGKTIEEVYASDPQYIEWITQQPWFREKYTAVFNTIINVGKDDEKPTPEHNRLQAKFLDDKFTTAFILHITKRKIGVIEGKTTFMREQVKRKHFRSKDDKNRKWGRTTIERNPRIGKEYKVSGKSITKMKIKELIFEHKGFDVLLSCYFYVLAYKYIFDYEKHERYALYQDDYCSFYIECKTTVGDEYPAVMRQIKTQMLRAKCVFAYLMIDEFQSDVLDRNQLKKYFETSDIRVVFIDEFWL